MDHPPGSAVGRAPPFTVLVFDRDDQVRLGLEELLTQEGWRCLSARTGEDALDLACQRQADVFILDIDSHETHDVVAIRDLRRLQPHTPVLLTTVERAAVDDDTLIRKPIDGEALLTMLRRLEAMPRHD